MATRCGRASWPGGMGVALAVSLCAGCYLSHEPTGIGPDSTCFPAPISIVLEDRECEMQEARGGDEIECAVSEPPPDRSGRRSAAPATWRAVMITNASTADGTWTVSGASLDHCTADDICFAYVRVQDDGTCACAGGGVFVYDEPRGTPGLGATLGTLLAGTSVTLLLHNPGAVYRFGGCAGDPVGR